MNERKQTRKKKKKWTTVNPIGAEGERMVREAWGDHKRSLKL